MLTGSNIKKNVDKGGGKRVTLLVPLHQRQQQQRRQLRWLQMLLGVRLEKGKVRQTISRVLFLDRNFCRGGCRRRQQRHPEASRWRAPLDRSFRAPRDRRSRRRDVRRIRHRSSRTLSSSWIRMGEDQHPARLCASFRKGKERT